MAKPKILLSISACLIIMTFTVLSGGRQYRQTSEDDASLSDPFVDPANGALTIELSMREGIKTVRDAQNAMTRALDLLSKHAAEKKVLKIAPGHYLFSRPVLFKEYHQGIEFMGQPEISRTVTARQISATRYDEEIGSIRSRLPIMDGDGVSSFLVVDGVAAENHLSTRVSGFYFKEQMAGLGGTHYPDFSYRLKDKDFMRNNGYYSRYAFNDGGVISVLGNSSIILDNNIIEAPVAYQCGGVLRNEQYGVTDGIHASVVSNNIVINPFAWHTGAFVDNNTGSYVKVLSNQIILDQEMPHEVDLITNFDYAFLVARNNRMVDARTGQHPPTIGIRILGPEGEIIRGGNRFEGIDEPHDHIAAGSPDFPPNRNFHFLFRKAKLLKLIKKIIDPRRFVRPGEWPHEMDPLVRTENLKDDDPLRIAALRRHFNHMRSGMQRPPM